MKRRNVLVAMAAAFTTACSKVGDSAWFGEVVGKAADMHRTAHRALGRAQMAREYARADISPSFRGNGTTEVATPEYAAHKAAGFAEWKLEVTGLVDRPLSLSLADLQALPQRSQITRHDCVEGWSAIGEWTGPQLSALLDMAGVQPDARYAVFRCADTLYGSAYYESCDMDDALHPQTIVAHMLNGAPLEEKNGAPLRMRIERQLGYKHAKYVTGVELVASLDGIGKGKGGYWEDEAGYQWYAGV